MQNLIHALSNNVVAKVLSLSVVALLLFSINKSYGDEFIVREGVANAEIITDEKPPRKTKLAALELQKYIEKISGAKLNISHKENADIAVKIYVGKSEYTDKLGISAEGLKHGAYKIKSGKNWLALIGYDSDFVPMDPWPPSWGLGMRKRWLEKWDKHTGDTYGFPYARLFRAYNKELGIWKHDKGGSLNAVYAFLRSLGIRWYFPGEVGEILPELKDIKLPVADKTVKPDFPMRRMGFWYGFYYSEDISLWLMRMGTNWGREMMGLTQNCHGSKYVYMRDEIKKAHPDWYRLHKGKRNTDHSYSGAPCLSSKGLFEKQLKFARFIFDVRKEPMLSLDVCDGYGISICQCEGCKDKAKPEMGPRGNLSNYVWEYINNAAKELYKTHPDKMVNGLSYSSYSEPPSNIDKLSPNIALVFCQSRTGFHDRETREKFVTRRQKWLEKLPSKELYIYEYYLNNRPCSPYVYIPAYIPRLISEDLKSLKGISKGDMIEVYRHHSPEKFSWNALATMHLNVYVTSLLWWDADKDVSQILEEFYRLYYGPAYKEMKAFIEYSEKNWPSMNKNAEIIGKAFELLAAAESAVKPDTVYAKRIGMISAYMKPLKALKLALERGRDNALRGRVLKRKTRGVNVTGDLSDETYWQPKIRVYRLYDNISGKMSGSRASDQPPASFQFFTPGNDSIQFGIRCFEPEMDKLKITTKEDDDPKIFEGDYVEIMIETLTHSYYRIAVNPAGAIYDIDMGSKVEGGDVRWSSGAKAAVKLNDDSWTVEVYLPWAGEMAYTIDPLQGVSGRKPTRTYPWWINICRQRTAGGKIQRSAWSPTGKDDFFDVSKFTSIYIK